MALHSNFGIIANFAGLFTMTGNDLKDSHPREKGEGPTERARVHRWLEPRGTQDPTQEPLESEGRPFPRLRFHQLPALLFSMFL